MHWAALSGWNADLIEAGRLQSLICWVFGGVEHPDRTTTSSHRGRHSERRQIRHHEVSSLTMVAGGARASGAQLCAKISITTIRPPQRGQQQGSGCADAAGFGT
jgi:hypothetical protein